MVLSKITPDDYTMIFGRQLSEEETRQALKGLHDLLKIQPYTLESNQYRLLDREYRGAVAKIISDLFVLYAKPFVKTIDAQKNCCILDRTINKWQIKKYADLRDLLSDFITSVCEFHRINAYLLTRETDDPTMKACYESITFKMGNLIKIIGNINLQCIVTDNAWEALYDRKFSLSSVYFIFQQGDPSVCKIGRTEGIVQRVSTLQTGNPRILIVHRIIQLDDYDGTKIESFLHNRYKNRRQLGEWFELTPEEVDQIDEKELVDSMRRSQGITTLYYRKPMVNTE